MSCVPLKRSLEFNHGSGGRNPKRRRRMDVGGPSSASTLTCHEPSPFGDVASKLTPEQISANVREVVKRLRRRKQLECSHNEANGDHHPQDIAMCESPTKSSSSKAANQTAKEKSLFTFKQVGLICERMLKERETEIREEYDRVLNLRMTEQYDAFVKFTHEQVQQRFEVSAAPSYLS